MGFKTKQIEVCDAILISINCKQNDWDDIKIGGPAMLGYEFGVAPDTDIDKLKKELKSLIKKYNRPFISFSQNIIEDFKVENLWTIDKIEKCIKENNIC